MQNIKGINGGARCATGGCVSAELVAEGVRVTSTIPGNDGAVVFTGAEWNAFLGQVKGGHWDHTLTPELVA